MMMIKLPTTPTPLVHRSFVAMFRPPSDGTYPIRFTLPSCLFGAVSWCVSVTHATLSQTPPILNRFPRVLEQNVCCEAMGACGFRQLGQSRMSRRNLMILSLTANFVGFILTLLSCLALSQNFNILTAFPFTSGHVHISEINQVAGGGVPVRRRWDDDEPVPVNIAVGLRAAAMMFADDEPSDGVVYTFDQFCAQKAGDVVLANYFPPSSCKDCKDYSAGMAAGLLLSLLAYIPSMMNAFTRMYYHYDVNCIKTFAMIRVVFSLAMALNTMLNYRSHCFTYFYRGSIAVQNIDNSSSSSSSSVLVVDFDWVIGLGAICLTVASGLNVVEFIAHAILPSPTIARSRQEQAAYEAQHAKVPITGGGKDKESPNDQEAAMENNDRGEDNEPVVLDRE